VTPARRRLEAPPDSVRATAPTSRDRPEGEPAGAPIGRAAFLGMIAVGAAGIVIGPSVSGGVNRALSSLIPDRVASAVSGDGWRIYSVSPPMPTFDPASYALRIGGLVARPRSLRWREVAALPGDEQVSDFHCVTGWSVAGVRWEGIRPTTVLDLVSPLPRARYVSFVSLEAPYADQITLDQFRLEDVMLARGMDGRPLSRVHGAPLRVVIPQMYGYKGVKWLSEIRFDAEPEPGFWERRGYDVNAWVGRSNDIVA
jgi:DMSO/TMAO reductase YedYZ molybdopterin-dependent catalytic subunit